MPWPGSSWQMVPHHSIPSRPTLFIPTSCSSTRFIPHRTHSNSTNTNTDDDDDDHHLPYILLLLQISTGTVAVNSVNMMIMNLKSDAPSPFISRNAEALSIFEQLSYRSIDSVSSSVSDMIVHETSLLNPVSMHACVLARMSSSSVNDDDDDDVLKESMSSSSDGHR